MSALGKRLILCLAGGLALLALAACTDFSFGPAAPRPVPSPTATGPLDADQTIGSGPVRVALLLPLSGNPGLASVGQSMRNAARLAMDYIEQNPNAGRNITIAVKDTAGNPALAAQRTREALAEGAALVLGPLTAEEVRAAGSVAGAGGVSVIGFSNNSTAAAPGVYLLNVLAETEVRRSLAYARRLGRRSAAALVPATEAGRIQQAAFVQATGELGLGAGQVHSFSSEAGIDRSRLTVVGSADWDGDAAITGTLFLAGAIYPAVDGAGLAALRAEYEARYGLAPHPFATLSYTAVLLANSSALSQITPRFDRAVLTQERGFVGRDGQFRLYPDGRSDYALAIKQVSIGAAGVVDGPRLSR